MATGCGGTSVGEGTDHHSGESTCPICFRSFDGIAQTTTPCGHVFCTSCIVEATARSAQGRSCPMCRTSFPGGYMDVPADELTAYLLKVRSRHSQTAGRHVVRFAYGNSVLPLKAAQGGSRWCAFFRVDGSATARGRKLTEGDYIDRCEFVVHHGSRDERVTVAQPPYELRRNSISSAALGDGSRRSASPMIGVMVELRVVWRPSCHQAPLTLHLAINLQGATHSCAVEFDSAPPPNRTPREQQQSSSGSDRAMNRASRRHGGGASASAADTGEAGPEARGQTSQLIKELESMRAERAEMLRAKAVLERATQDSQGIASTASPAMDLLPRMDRRAETESDRSVVAMGAGREGGGRRGRAAVVENAGRVMGQNSIDDGGGDGVGVLARRLGVGRQLRAAIEASEAREKARQQADLTATRSRAFSDRASGSGAPRSGTSDNTSEGRTRASQSQLGAPGHSASSRSRSAPSVSQRNSKPEPEVPVAVVKKRAADPQRLSRLAQPTAVKQALEHSAQELAELRRGYARQGLPRQPYSEEIIAEHGLTFLGLGTAEVADNRRASGSEDVRRGKDITRMRALLTTGTADMREASGLGLESNGGTAATRKRTPGSGRRSKVLSSTKDEAEGAQYHWRGTGSTRGARAEITSLDAMAVSAVSELEIAGGRSLPRAARRFVMEAVQEKSQRDEREAFRFH